MATDKRASTQSGQGNLAFKRLRKHREIAVDRISELPDSLLLLILSFLPALYVARTCILSRRWQNLWTSVPRLDFSYDRSYEEFWYSASFVKFVNRFLLKYKGSSIHTFKLTSYLADSCDAELWMRWAINRNVKVLNLQFPHLPLYLPQSASGSKSLMVLKLCGQQLNMTAPPSSRFPCLKTLKLYSSKISDGEFENALIACCDVLENLSIRRARYAEMKSLRVDARQLKHLKLDLSELSESKGTGCLIEINAPALEDLDIRVYGSCSLLIKNVGTLSKAEIYLSNSKAFRSLIKCFSALESVKSLSLSSSYSRKACILKPGPMVRNVNLTHLTIGAKSVWAQLLPYFFDCFPNLEVLILKKESPVGHHVAGDLCIDPILLPANLAPRLRVFESGEFTEMQLGMLKCLLMNCSVLETARIHYLYTSQTRYYSTRMGTEAREIEEKLLECEEKRCELEQKLRVTQKILSFPRASHKCEIKFI